MQRRVMMAGNWKMNKTISEAINLAVRLKYACNSVDDRDIVLCPPYPSLKPVAETVSDSGIEVGAQNMHYETAGAYTGEVSPPMVKDTGASWVILGHSERRQYFGEEEKLLARKLNAAVEHGLRVFLCIGESEAQREAGEVEAVISRQLTGALQEFEFDQFEDLVIAYEPIWAIGTGNTATPEQANEAHQIVRKYIGEIFSSQVAEQIRVVYGGSVKPHNVEELMAQPDIDGALVGGASLQAEDFTAIVKYDLEDRSSIPGI
ncbi:MAG: triose-phosphate isomerase [bacterium]